LLNWLNFLFPNVGGLCFCFENWNDLFGPVFGFSNALTPEKLDPELLVELGGVGLDEKEEKEERRLVFGDMEA